MPARYRDGLLDEGAHVIDAGQVGTEMLYFLVGSRELDGGLMCTASHNPKAYTGAKLVSEGAIALSGDSGIRTSAARSSEGARRGGGSPEAPGGGSVEEVDVYEEFQAAALKFIDPARREAAEGRRRRRQRHGRPDGRPAAATARLDLVETYWTPDGNFPDHEPNPLLPENRQLIIEKVRATGADLGIAWDGDADRCFFIDDTGAFVDGDFLTALLAEHLLVKQPGSDILYDVRASRAVPDTVTAAGGTPYINRVGHAFFKTRMRKEGSLFGGEVSGHYYFRDFYCADSGTIPALLILELLSEGSQGDVRAARPLPRAVLHLGGDQLRGRRSRRQDGGDRARTSPTRARTASTASRSTTTTGTSTCAVEHRAAAAPVPRSRSCRRRTWSAAATRCSR